MIGLCACEKRDSSKFNTFMHKGLSYYHQGKFEKALRYFERALVIEQDNPSAVLFTALMYDELETDLNRAAELYKQYIKSDSDPNKKQLAKNWLKAVESRIGYLSDSDSPVQTRKSGEKDNDQSLIERLTAQTAQKDKIIAELRKESSLTREMLEKVLAKEKEYQTVIERLSADIKSQTNELALYKSHTVKPMDFRTSMSDAPQLHEETVQPFSVAMTYTVQEGDTLHTVAKQYYGDDSLWSVLWETNKFQMGNNKTLTAGQVLIIPRIMPKR
jgi:nucleoid-associated protein YgaU